MILIFSFDFFTLGDGTRPGAPEEPADVRARNIHPIAAGTIAFLALLALALPARGITYLTMGEAMDLAFGEGAQIERHEFRMTEAEAEEFAERFNVRFPPEWQHTIFVGKKDGEVIGYAFVLTEASRYRPITMLVDLTPELRVEHVEVMIYREPRGGEVQRDVFVDQYEGRANYTMQLGREIRSISGATISAQVMTYGVNKALFLAHSWVAQNPPPAAGKSEQSRPGSASQPETRDEGKAS